MKHLSLALVFLLSYVVSFGRGSMVLGDRPFTVGRAMDTSVFGPLSRHTSFINLSERSKELYYWTNLVRRDPKTFLNKYIKPFLEQFPEARSSESKSLVSELDNIQPMSMLMPSGKLLASSQEHSDFLALKGALSHTGKGGKNFPQRMQALGITNCAGENVFDGQDDALLAIILLLIDQGVPGVGHRKALLNPAFRVAGISVAYMRDGRMVLTQQFSCE